MPPGNVSGYSSSNYNGNSGMVTVQDLKIQLLEKKIKGSNFFSNYAKFLLNN